MGRALSPAVAALFCVIVCCVDRARCGLAETMYTVLPASPCTRLLWKNGTIGCTSSTSGNVGALWPLLDSASFDSFVKQTPSEARMIVLASDLFTKSNVAALTSTNKVIGLLVTNFNSHPRSAFSPELVCPDLSAWPNTCSYAWNSAGDAMMYQNFAFPIVALSDKESSDSVIQKSLENLANNAEFPRWGMQMQTNMHATDNSVVCLRRQLCKPLGGYSVWGSAQPVEVSAEKKLVFVTARLDSTGFFHDLSKGAEAEMSALASLLAAVDAISRLPANVAQQMNRQLAYGVFTGEAWGFIGSGRFIKDVTSFKCSAYVDDTKQQCETPWRSSLEFQKIRLSNIAALVHVDQLGLVTDDIFVHMAKHNEQSQDLLDSLKSSESAKAAVPRSFRHANAPEMPPSPLIKFLEADSSIPSILLSDYDTEFVNKFYHSRFDDLAYVASSNNASDSNNTAGSDVPSNRTIPALCGTATALARGLFALAAPSNVSVPANLTVSCELLAEIFYCLTSNSICTLYRDLLSVSSTAEVYTPTNYAGVYPYRSLTATFVHDFIADRVQPNDGTQVPCSATAACPDARQQCIAKRCVTARVFYHDALSTAFEVNTDFSFSGASSYKIVDPSQPMWTESDWATISVRVFLQDNPANEIGFLVFSLVLFLGSVAASWGARRFLLKRYKLQ